MHNDDDPTNPYRDADREQALAELAEMNGEVTPEDYYEEEDGPFCPHCDAFAHRPTNHCWCVGPCCNPEA